MSLFDPEFNRRVFARVDGAPILVLEYAEGIEEPDDAAFATLAETLQDPRARVDLSVELVLALSGEAGASGVLELARQRLEAVRRRLVEHGVDEGRITTVVI